MRVVFDSNVLARAHQRAHGPARRALLHVIAGPDILVLSRPLLEELERVLAYPRLVKRSGLTSLDVGEFVDFLAQISTVVTPASVPQGLLRDESDVPVLGTAFAGRADVICTRDADFFEDRVQDFAATRGIRILNDVELLSSLTIRP